MMMMCGKMFKRDCLLVFVYGEIGKIYNLDVFRYTKMCNRLSWCTSV